jgi:hypothetical protein
MYMEKRMKKSLVLAMTASLLMAGSAFAARNLVTAPNATFPFGAPGVASGPASTNNDDTCDISTAPAATLLLPYFEVDFKSAAGAARTTIFTITNTSRMPQIAHVVLWTDWSFAALDFNIFLTGYDVQSINLYDIFQRGMIAPITATTGGTSVTTSLPTGNPANAVPANNVTGNPNFNTVSGSSANVATACSGLLGQIPTSYITDLQNIFTTGAPGSNIGAGCSGRLGGTHANAIGYVTIDVASTCSQSLPGPNYFNTEVLFDNTLIGDYQDINPNTTTGNYAGGNPLVHIRAVPEGGPAGSVPGTNLPYTFYDRYTATTPQTLPRTVDRRQPLPSTFAARFIQGGTTSFSTNYKIWREGITGPSSTACGVSANSALGIAEIVRFDEHENATTLASSAPISPAPVTAISLPETSATNTTSGTFPALSSSGDVGGWMYLNLNNGGAAVYSVAPGRTGFAAAGTAGPRASQNWVIVSMFAEGRYSVDFDAAWLGNGCSPGVVTGGTIGPNGGVAVCPAPAVGLTIACTPGVAPYTGTNTTP